MRDKTASYKLIELMYNSLLQNEVFSSGAGLCSLWNKDDPTGASKPEAWKNMTKDLIKWVFTCQKFNKKMSKFSRLQNIELSQRILSFWYALA